MREIVTESPGHTPANSTSTGDVAIVEIVTAGTTEKTAFVVNQLGDNDVADFQSDGVSIVNIAETGKVTIVGEMMVDGRLMICSGGACGSSLDTAVDETMGDLGIEGTVVAGTFKSYCEDGYVWVPGSSKYGTMPGFCVAQDEAYYVEGGANKEKIKKTNITQGEAMMACEQVGGGYHLLSENEWLTIAENVIRVISNDSNREIDNLQLAVAQSDFATGSADIIATSSQIVFSLSNGNLVYDLAGGVAEWTNKTLPRDDMIQPISVEWQEYSTLYTYNGLDIAPPYYYSSANGIGRVKTGDSTLNLRGFVRGATALYDLDLSNSPITATSSIGFRCAK